MYKWWCDTLDLLDLGVLNFKLVSYNQRANVAIILTSLSFLMIFIKMNAVLYGDRTHNLTIRSRTLYPIELTRLIKYTLIYL